MRNKNRSTYRIILVWLVALLVPCLVVAQTMQGNQYQLENPTFDFGGENSSSTNYSSRDTMGDEADQAASSSSFQVSPGMTYADYPGVPGVPFFANTGGALYSSLDFVVNPADNSPDTNFAIAISSDNFATTYYIQDDDTVGTDTVWQTYADWGGAAGGRVTGLAANTEYKIKVKARYGPHSETAFSATATASTFTPTITFVITGEPSGVAVAGEFTSVNASANTIAYDTLAINIPEMAAQRTIVSTNASSGYTVTAYQDGNLRTNQSKEIDPVPGTNAEPAAWPTGISRGRFGYHSTDSLLCTGNTSRFSSNNTYAAMVTVPQEVACNSGPVNDDQTTVLYKIEVGSLQEAGQYQNIVTYIAIATF